MITSNVQTISQLDHIGGQFESRELKIAFGSNEPASSNDSESNTKHSPASPHESDNTSVQMCQKLLKETLEFIYKSFQFIYNNKCWCILNSILTVLCLIQVFIVYEIYFKCVPLEEIQYCADIWCEIYILLENLRDLPNHKALFTLLYWGSEFFYKKPLLYITETWKYG